MTKKMIKVTLVHIIRCWKGTFVSGTCTSGINLQLIGVMVSECFGRYRRVAIICTYGVKGLTYSTS